jgi:CHC2 zinc finger
MAFDRNLLPDPTGYFEARGLKLTGPRLAKWKTTACQFHGGSDSMRVNTEIGCWCCMSCGAKGGDVLSYEMTATGSEFVEAAKAIGAWVDDGLQRTHQKPTPLGPRAALNALAIEATLTAIAAGNIAKGVLLTDADRSRLMTAAGRINALAGAFS